MTFSEALEELKLGSKIYRAGWNGRSMYLYLHDPRGSSENLSRALEPSTVPYIVMYTGPSDNNHVPWLASQTDILAEDWSVR